MKDAPVVPGDKPLQQEGTETAVANPGNAQEEKQTVPEKQKPIDRKAISRVEQPGETSEAEGSEKLATEMPVPTVRRISQYLVSVDDTTGTVVRIEKVDPDKGDKKELSQDEYAAAYAYAGYSAPYYATYAASLYDPLSDPAIQTYMKAAADYAKAYMDYVKACAGQG